MVERLREFMGKGWTDKVVGWTSGLTDSAEKLFPAEIEDKESSFRERWPDKATPQEPWDDRCFRGPHSHPLPTGLNEAATPSPTDKGPW